MQATNFLTLRGGYVHHRSSSLHPFVTSYSLLRRHNYVALRSSYTVPASCFTSNPGSPGIPRNDYMEKVLKWVTTLSPLDEEYPEELKDLLPMFSKYSLFRYRMIIQVKWLLKQSDIPELNEVPKFSQNACSFLENIIYEFTESNMHEVENIDHVNEGAVIIYLMERSKNQSGEISQVLQNYQNTCNSEVIDQLAFGMMLKEAINSVMVPRMTDICKALFSMAHNNRHVSMGLRAQGQPPTFTLGRQLALVAYKLREQARCVSKIVILGQFRSGGENYIGDRYSEMVWRRINKELVTSLGLEFDSNVDSENHINKLILEVVNFNKILVDFFNKELQSYISSGYFKLEGDPIKFERNKINLLSLDKMIKTLDSERPQSKRVAGILRDMPQDLIEIVDRTRIVEDLPQDPVGVLGCSLVGYEAMLEVLKKLQ